MTLFYEENIVGKTNLPWGPQVTNSISDIRLEPLYTYAPALNRSSLPTHRIDYKDLQKTCSASLL